MRKNIIICILFICIIFILSKINILTPIETLVKYNIHQEVKSIETVIDLDNQNQLIIWMNEKNNIIATILKQNLFNSWSVIVQCGNVSTNNTNLDNFIYYSSSPSKKKSKYNNIFLGYINNVENLDINNIFLNNKECSLVYSGKNIIWYSFQEYKEALPKIEIKYNKNGKEYIYTND